MNRFADHRRAVAVTVAGLEVRDISGAGRGRDPIDHGSGKARMLGDPIGQPRVPQGRERQHRAAQHLAVALDVVAAHRREGGTAGDHPPPQGPDQHADGAARAGRRGEVAGDGGVIGIERLGCGI
jgi:hypothetical protein